MKLTNEERVRTWFGIIDDWIFIHDSLDEYDEVELYPLNSMYSEAYDGWKRKDFSWAKDNLLKLIPKEPDEESEDE